MFLRGLLVNERTDWRQCLYALTNNLQFSFVAIFMKQNSEVFHYFKRPCSHLLLVILWESFIQFDILTCCFAPEVM